MKKFLVDVYLPAAGKHFDAYLPAAKQIGEATRLLAELAGPLSGGSYQGTADALLLDAGSGRPFPRGDTVADAGIRNAARLILI